MTDASRLTNDMNPRLTRESLLCVKLKKIPKKCRYLTGECISSVLMYYQVECIGFIEIRSISVIIRDQF